MRSGADMSGSGEVIGRAVRAQRGARKCTGSADGRPS